MDNLREYQQDKLNEFKKSLKEHSVHFSSQYPKIIELTKDQYKVHEDDKNK